MIVLGAGGIKATMIADSAHPNMDGRRLMTMQLCYPRFIHAEFMTHRVFSRNASSSRAIPVAKVIEQVRNNPAIPIHWGKNQPGMQADEQLTGQELEDAQDAWTRAANFAANAAEDMMKAGAHKQVANRILEPFQFMHVILTATEFDNFFALRDHEAAEPHIRELARCMLELVRGSEPRRLQFGDWHLPYVTDKELHKHGIAVCLKLSAARCARVSYLTHEGKIPDVQKDIELFDRLVGSVPIHASPIEHQATPDPLHNWPGKPSPHLWGNLVHWVQHRKLHEQRLSNLEGEQQ